MVDVSQPGHGGGHAIVLVGPAGAGKTTIAHRLIAARPQGRAFSVSHTTRPIRATETDGVDYHFVDRATFLAKVARGDFVEWAEVHGNLYGTTRAAITHHFDAGRDVIFDVDIEGAGALAAAFPDAVRLIFLTPADWATLVARLQARGSESPETMARRLRTARSELLTVLDQDRNGVPWLSIRNVVLDEAMADVEAGIAARQRSLSPDERARLERMLAEAEADPRTAPVAPSAG